MGCSCWPAFAGAAADTAVAADEARAALAGAAAGTAVAAADAQAALAGAGLLLLLLHSGS